MKTTDRKIEELVTDLSPVSPSGTTTGPALAWLVLSLVYVALISLMFGHLRPGVNEQLMQSPRFFFEMLLGLVAITLGALALFRAAVPGALNSRLRWAFVLSVSLWVLNYVVSLSNPALEPSMLGKRLHCFTETLLYSVPPMLAALYLQRRLYPLRERESAWIAGTAAGLMPAWFMQVACMYDPAHILTLHILPGLLVGVLSVIAVLVLPARRQSGAGDSGRSR